MSLFRKVWPMGYHLGYLLEMQISELKLRPTKLESVKMGCRSLYF